MKNAVVIVGAGAAGIGMGVLLKRLNIPFVIIDKFDIAASFKRWSKETRFISPSFAGNAFGEVDLNAVTPDTSPAFSLRCEHPTGAEYARYLEDLVAYFELPVRTKIAVDKVEYRADGEFNYLLHIDDRVIGTNYLIWATGEFAFPDTKAFYGASHCLHYARVKSWAALDGDEFNIIGAYESGVDAAYQLTKLGKKVTLFDANKQIAQHGSDSSYSISPFTRERFNSVRNRVRVVDAVVKSVVKDGNRFELETTAGSKFQSPTPPINCTGFAGGVSQIEHLFDCSAGYPLLNQYDESTLCPNLFLVGPQVRHDQAIFCFIYKYRQRFGVIAEQLSERLNSDSELCQEVIEQYREQNFYLSDLSCCDDECVC